MYCAREDFRLFKRGVINTVCFRITFVHREVTKRREKKEVVLINWYLSRPRTGQEVQTK